MRFRRSLGFVSVVSMIAALLVAFGSSPASATDKITTTQSVSTKMRCRANVSLVGNVDADQTVALESTYPKYVEQGSTFDVVSKAGDTEIPTESSGIAVNNLKDLKLRVLIAGGFTLTNVQLVPGTGGYKPTPSSPSQAIPGSVTILNDGVQYVGLQLSGPFAPGSILTAPQLRITLTATGAPGTKITARFAGTIPSNLSPPFPDWGFAITPNVNAPVIGNTDVAASCAPNYGPFANGNGEPLGTVPNLTDTTIISGTNPLVNLTSPGDGDKYLPDAEVFADYACVETVYALVSCDATAPDGSQLDFSEFGQKTFTVTATDANGGVTSRTATYDVGGNIAPEVNAGTDQTVNGGALVTLLGSAVDPDTGQTLSYQWSQVGGPAVVLNPDDANDPFEPNQRFVAPRGGPHTLTFRLRVDDGFDSAEDTVVVNVSANNGPVVTNGAAQVINNVKTGATVSVNGTATDPEGDTPITYAWSQVDGSGDPIAIDDPLAVTFLTPNAATSSFKAPAGPAALHLQVLTTDSLGATAVGTVTVNVLANNPPVITAGATQTLNKKTSVATTLDGAATDPDNAAPSANHVLTYSWTQVDENGDLLNGLDPLHVTLSSETVAQPTFTTPADPGTLHFRVAVSDSYDTTIGNVTVNVLGSEAPLANAGPDQTPGRGRVVTLDGSGSIDPDSDPLTYAWTQVDDNGDPLDSGDPLYVTLSSAIAQKPTFTAPVITGPAQSIHFQLVVADVPYGLVSPPDVVDITLLENQAPVANAGAAQTNKFANAVVTLNGTASADPDTAETLSYAWVQVDPTNDLPLDPGPTKVTLSNAAAVSPTFPTPHLAAATTLKFQLVVTDLAGLSSAAAFTTVQVNANRAPTVGTPSVTPTTRTVGVTATITVPASAADADGDPVAGFTYQWVQTDNIGVPCAPSCAIANVTTTQVVATPRSATFTVPSFSAASATLYFRLTIGDGFGATVQSNNLTVTLTNSAPSVQFAIRPTGMAATNVTTNNTSVNQIYNGQTVQLDATQNPAQTLSTLDPDGTTGFTYLWRHVTTSGGSTLCTTNCAFGGATAQSTVAQPTFTMPNNAQVFMRLTVTDQFGVAATVINFTLNRVVNTAPTVTATGPAFATQGDTGVALTGTATDPNTSSSPAQTLTRQWTQVDGAGVALPVEDPMHVTLTGDTTLTPTFDAPATPGVVRFKLTVSDGAASVSATHTMDIVLASNGAPTADAGPDQTGVPAGAGVQLDGSASSDPEGHTITYAWTQVDDLGDPVPAGPGQVSLSSATAQKPTFTAPGTGAVTLHFRLVVTDQYTAVSAPDTVDISVGANGTPTANAGPDQSAVSAGATVHLDGTASSDPEGHTLTYAWTQVDDLGDPVVGGVALSSATAAQPTFPAPGTGPVTLHFRLVVTDQFGAVSDADSVDISVDANGTPNVDAGPDQSGIAAGATVTLDGSGSSDPEGAALGFGWVQVDDLGDPVVGGVTLSSATVASPTFTAPATGPVTLHFKLTVADPFLAVATDTVDISVNANGLPVANAGPNQVGLAPAMTVTLDGSASSDPENHSITYAWTQVNLAGVPITPTVTLSSATAQKPTFTAPTTPTGTNLRFRLVVTDQYGAVSSDSFVIISVGFNLRPLANAGPDQTPGRGALVTLDGSGSADPEATALSYQWVQVDAGNTPILPGNPLAVALSNENAQKPTFTAPIAVADLNFRLFVTDAGGLISDPDAVVIHLVANNAPVANAGVAQTNKATNATVSLNGTASSDIDLDPLTYAWTQVDPATDLPVDPGPGTVTLSSATAASPTFVAPHFLASTTLKFQLVVTDPSSASGPPSFTTVQINANRAPSVGTPSVTPSSRPIGTTVTITVPASAADADGDPVAGFTYQWVQTNSAGVACSPTCPIANITLTPVPATPRSATFTIPGFTQAGTAFYFRLTVNDGFGASVQSNTLTVAPTNTAPNVPNPPTLRTGLNLSVVNPTNIYIGSLIELDAAASFDPDGVGGLTYTWTGQPCGGLGESLGCLFASGASGWPGGSCRGIAITPVDGEPGKARFTAPPLGDSSQNPNVCGLRLVVTDVGGATTTRNFSYGLKANVGPPVAVINTLPAKMLASSATTPSVLALSGSASTDPDTNPTQPLAYSWLQIDPATGNPVASDSPAKGTFSSPNTVNTTWTAPSTAPHSVQFRLTVTDSITFPASSTSPVVKVTTTRPGANAGPDQITNPDAVVELDGSASYDADLRPLTYSWKQISGPLVTLTSPFTTHPGFVAPSLGHGVDAQIYTFELTTRNGFAASYDTVTVINEPWAAPVADAGANQAVNTATAGVQLDGSGSTKSAPTPLTYQWSQTAGPAVTLSSLTAQKPTFTAPVVTQAMGPQELTFQLVVNDGYGDSAAATTTVTVNPVPEVPGAPTTVVATPANGSASVTFVPGPANGSPIILFYVRCTSSTGGVARAALSGAGGTTVTGLTNGALYTCTSQAANSVGVSPESAPSAVIRPAAPPSAPTNVVAVTGNGTANITFTPGNNGGEPFTLFWVQCDSSNGGVAQWNLFGPGFATLTGLTNGKTYSCWALAGHALGLSPRSASSPSFVVGVPSPPTDVKAVPGNNQATVSWTAAATNGATITSHIVTPYIGSVAQTPITIAGSGTSLVVAGLANSSVYTFKVAAVNNRGTGIASAASAPVTIGTPVAPPSASASPGSTQATVSWTAPANSGSAITGYSVTPYIGTTAQAVRLFASTATSQIVTGLTNGTTYTFVVSAINARGAGPSTTTAPVTVGAPTAPTLIVASAGAGSATVTWSAPTNNGSAVTNYIVRPVKAGVVQPDITYNASALTRTISGLTAGTSYTFSVLAVNARGTSPQSSASNPVTPT